MTCASCGYPRDIHDVGTLKCPLCACGDVPGAHEVLPSGVHVCSCGCGAPAWQHSPDVATALWHGKPCPGRRSKASGEWLLLRRGTYKQASPIATVGPTAPDDVALPPQVPARAPLTPGEYAGYGGRQAVGLGRAGVALGWLVTAHYWRAGDGTEGCAVKLSKGPLRAVATWGRSPGKQGSKSGWTADVAYAWRVDVRRAPTKVTHTELLELIK